VAAHAGRAGRVVLILSRLEDMLRADGVAVLVTVETVAGSAPRDAGAHMLVRPNGDFHGTIGGGALEWDALRMAREFFAPGREPVAVHDFALGPELAQCCGGRVRIRFERLERSDADRVAELVAHEYAERALTPLALFGAGHVGRALVLALAPLPFKVRWIDERPDAFPTFVPSNATKVATPNPAAELDGLPDGAFVLVMTHSHPRDLDIVTRALHLDRFAYVGLIGSATKRARFENRMTEAGLPAAQRAKLVCPIGIPGLDGKEPATIAASTAASLLLVREAVRNGANHA
jgi:xanthine dehydrogenase accessory factor